MADSRPNLHRGRRTTASWLLTWFAPLLAVAAPAAQHDAAKLEEVMVVGSHLSQPAATAISVITAAQIRERGFTTTSDVLRSVSENSGGGFDAQLGTFTFSPAASAVNLRDLGFGRSLVLLDGRRLPMYPLGWNGTDSFVDIGSIPVGAIERVEVLTDGASAIYGSDALAGVVNIVLKKNPVNEVSLHRSGTTQGGGGITRWQLSTGARSDTGSVLFMAEYAKHQPMWYAQRQRSQYDQLGGPTGSGPGSFSVFGYPGTYTNASETQFQAADGCTIDYTTPSKAGGLCFFNRAAYRHLRPEQNDLSASLRVTQQLNDSLEVFANLMGRKADQDLQSEPQALDARYDLGLLGPIAALSSDPNNPYPNDGSYLRRMTELGPLDWQIDTRSYLIVAGIKGQWAQHWDWEFSIQTSRQHVSETFDGLMLASQMTQALQGQLDFNGDGTPDVFDLAEPIPAQIAQQLAYRAHNEHVSSLSVAQWLMQGELLQLPTGPVQLAVLGEYARERYANRPDAAILANDVVFFGGVSGGGDRARYAMGFELQGHLASTLTMNFAARYDKYQDDSTVGGALSPRLMLQWQPVSAWGMRGSVGLNFRAPDMQRLFGGETRSSYEVFNTPRCVKDIAADNGNAACVNSVFAVTRTTANPQLAEEKGVHYSFGTVWQPHPQWSASLDYFAIDLKHLVQTPDPQYVLDENAANGRFSDWISERQTPNCQSSAPSGTCLDLHLQPINIARKKTSGLEFKLDGQWPTSLGRWTTQLGVDYLLDVTMREADNLPAVSVLAEGKLGEVARVKGHAAFGWAAGNWSANSYINYVGPFTPVLTNVQQRIGSFTTVNVNASYTLPTRTMVQLGVNNVFNREPPIATYRGNQSEPFFHEQFHTLDGATWIASIKQPF